ncbi:TrlF family AAA-like ATPase [Peribacillus frigoritolerans]|uniref:TrlF family AAA-like ATPase n=1 Tax=Peribacillus frigoritolerans TaxID=450367 RepID=UPI00203AA33C|nr:PHP domain-containing protein [Peribacillus frigoritolerans]MCM3169433.1 hypothetical protein [Peribacillus frigoritolerans]
MSYKGARWYKTDLHLHTPASKCFKDRDVTAEQWVNRCLEQQLDVVAVTDHNSGEWIDEIKKAAEGTKLVVFPGVEVTCSESKVHILILFDIEKSRQDIEDFLIKIKIDRDYFATAEANSELSTIQIVEEAAREGAIAIPAHIDEFNGLSVIAFNNRDNLLKNEHVNSVQVVHEMFYNQGKTKDYIEETLRNYYNKDISEQLYKEWKITVNQALEKKKTILTFSDNPHKQGDSKHGLWGIGQRFTWIKMNEEVNIESLKQALFLPDHRIRNDFDSKLNPYSLPDYWFKKIKIKNTLLNKDEIEIDFNPQMNSIIGGRGSGKSSILRFIRGVFQKIEDLELADIIGSSNLKKEQENFFKVSSNNRGILLKDSIIEIEVNKYGTDYKIVAKNFKSGEPKDLKVLKKDTKDQYVSEETTSLKDFFKYDIYSQKQIYEIASHPNSLRDRIDSSIVEMEELNNNLKKKKNEYLEQSTKIRSLAFRISQNAKVNSDIRDKKEQINSFKESGFEELVQMYKTFNKENEILKTLYETLKEKKEEITNLRSNFIIQEIETQNFQLSYQSEIKKILGPVYDGYEVIQSILQDAETRLSNLNEDFTKSLIESAWYKDKKENVEDFKHTKEELAEKGIDDLDKLEVATNELIKLEKELKAIEFFEEDLKNQYTRRNEIYSEYVQLRKEVTALRKEFLNEILNDENIQIDIKNFRDRNQYIKRFREIIQKETGYNDDINKIGDKCINGKDVIKNQQKIIEDLINIRNNNLSEYGGHFENAIKDLNEEQLDELILHFPEDEIAVKYKPNDSSSFQLLSNASAGQKTSAILTFLLSYGNVPLLLDQPEDDLDNHLIYELIVDRLKVVKGNRQIIVVTHNANIPVNGDTEWLIAMDSKSKDIKVMCNGTIEEYDIKTEICDVMEGGEKAFKLRSKRYNL